MNYDEMKKRVRMIEERQLQINLIQTQLALLSEVGEVGLYMGNGITVKELVGEWYNGRMKKIFLEGLKDRLVMLKKEITEIESTPEGGTKL